MIFRSRRIAITGVAARDKAAAQDPAREFERHFAEHYAPLFRFLRSFGAAEALAEDLAQESFLRLHRHLAAKKPAPAVRAWLYRVAYHLWIDRLREGQREGLAEDHSWDFWSRVLRDPAPGSEQELLTREREERVRAAMRRLSQVERQALSLRADGLTYREVAQVLGIGYWPAVEAVRRALDILGEEANGL